MHMDTDTHEMTTGDPQHAPISLELGDGSRLVLEEADASPIVCRVEGMREERINLDDAMQLSGQPFAGFRLLR